MTNMPPCPSVDTVSTKKDIAVRMRGIEMYYSLGRLKLKLLLSQKEDNESLRSLLVLSKVDALDAISVRANVTEGKKLLKTMHNEVDAEVKKSFKLWSDALVLDNAARYKREQLNNNKEKTHSSKSGPSGGPVHPDGGSLPGGPKEHRMDIQDEIDFNSI
jgi:hypothetical protein